MYKAKIVGNSMLPTFHSGQMAYFRKCKRYHKGDIVLAKYEGQLIVKRIANIRLGIATLLGDNKYDSIVAEVPIEKIKAKYYAESGLKALSNKIYCDLLNKWGG